MKLLVTGACGQLGHAVMKELVKRGHSPIASDIYTESEFSSYIKLDITNAQSVGEAFKNLKPDAVIHCAAWTKVDDAEDPDKWSLVQKVNVEGTKNIALCCKEMNIKMMYISTDYVFNGEGDLPWEADCKNYSPLNHYGATKLRGELAVSSMVDKFFVVRISWVFGENGSNFVNKMLELARKKYTELKVVDDQVGTPTYATDLAMLLVDMIETEKYGYYHATNEGGYISWADFAEEVFKQVGINIKINRVSTKEYGISKAVRPLNSRMDKSKLSEAGFNRLPDWKDALRRYLVNIKE